MATAGRELPRTAIRPWKSLCRSIGQFLTVCAFPAIFIVSCILNDSYRVCGKVSHGGDAVASPTADVIIDQKLTGKVWKTVRDSMQFFFKINRKIFSEEELSVNYGTFFIFS